MSVITTEFNEEVLFATDPIVRVDAQTIHALKEKARSNRRRRIRLCAHRGIEDNIHEMLIVHEKGCYVQPHMHINKIESFHIIEGMADIVLFNDGGQITDTIPMGDYRTGRNFFYRLPPTVFHTLWITTDVLVFHEVTNGPFRPEDTVWAPWSPEETEDSAVSMFIAKMVNWIEENSEHGQ